MRTEDLIEQMAATAEPVRRLPAPFVLALVWLVLAVVLVTLVVLVLGWRPNLAAQLAEVEVLVPWLASIFTGVLAVLAATHLAAPDRSAMWRWVPLPAFALWVATLGGGCFAEWRDSGDLTMAPGLDCLPEIMLISLPLSLLLFLLLRHAAAIRPVSTAVTGALAVAALASAGMELFHHGDGALTVLVWHAGTVTLVVTGFALVGRPLFRLIAIRKPRFAR